MARNRQPRQLTVNEAVNAIAALPPIATPNNEVLAMETTQTQSNATPVTISWEDGKGYKKSAPYAELSERNVIAMVNQAIRHRMGNMADARVNSFIRTEKLGLPASNPKEWSESQKADARKRITQWGKENEAEKYEKLCEYRDDEWEKIVHGTIDDPTRGPRLDPIEREYQTLLVNQAKKDLAGKTKDDFPTKDDESVTLNNGKVLTRRQMLDITAQRYGEEFRTRAEAIVAARNESAKTAVEEPASPDDF